MEKTDVRRGQNSTSEAIVDILEQIDFTGFRDPKPKLPRLRMKYMIDDYQDEPDRHRENSTR